MAEKEEKIEKQGGGSVFPEIERDILLFWKEKGIFKKSLEKESPKGEYVFYDGPPFATGEPHYGHMLPGTIKDVIPRFKTMQGYHVPRRWGWDCHGLPVENLVEKELGLKSKKDIEDFGIEKFNAAAKESVMRYADSWREVIPRVGRFVDMDDDYRTMDPSYTESVWWSFKTLYEKRLIYKGFKSMHICPRCETTLSNFEVTQGYQDIKDISVFVKFKLVPGQKFDSFVSDDKTFFLAWTTTPWTLPGNVALAVGEKVQYGMYKKDSECFIVAKERADVLGDGYELIKTVTGKELVDFSYEPLFPYYANDSKLKNRENGWKVYAENFVTTEDGTGIVHIAPAFGEDDMNLAQKENLPFVQHVGMDGRFKDEVKDFVGEQVKPKGHHMETDAKILAWLEENGQKVFKTQDITHSYPHCWRCDTPLLNYAASSWFVKVTDFKDKLVAENKKIEWIPETVGENRFGNWLEGARDWAISRTRFWGAPLPVWKCEKCDKEHVVGSVADLKEKLPRKNRYLIMRHGEAENNSKMFVSSSVDAPVHLTENGKEQVKNMAIKLKDRKIDVIIASPLVRTKETAEIVGKELGLPVHLDKRFREVEGGELDGKPIEEYREFFRTHGSRYVNRPPRGECQADVRARVAEALDSIDEEYEGKTILIVSHETPLWLVEMIANGFDRRASEAAWKASSVDFIANAEVRDVDFTPLPHDASGEIDLHRPFIDKVTFSCECGSLMRRVPDVFDCWYESGSMPFASPAYKGEALPDFDPKKHVRYPADFISESLDQTRGWFYSLIVLGQALFGHAPYKKVIVSGLILAESGQKMSKRLKNYPDILDVVEKYGADALRLYILSTSAVQGGEMRFSERGVLEISRKTLGRLHNCLSFLELNAPSEKAPRVRPESENILDHWIFARLSETAASVTKDTEKGELDRATRLLHDFVDDLSIWYVRRSRDRFKSDDVADRAAAAASLAHVLLEFSKILAPFAPFYADHLYKKVGGEKESVHLEEWPNYPALTSGEKGLLNEMADARSLVSKALEARAAASVKVRQPLSKLSLKRPLGVISDAMKTIIAEEVNVKEVVLNDEQGNEIILDTTMTPELKAEGDLRELIRAIQDLRKKAGLKQGEEAVLNVSADSAARAYFEPLAEKLEKACSISKIMFDGAGGGELFELNGHSFGFSVQKGT